MDSTRSITIDRFGYAVTGGFVIFLISQMLGLSWSPVLLFVGGFFLTWLLISVRGLKIVRK
jgi:hypothetical protein